VRNYTADFALGEEIVQETWLGVLRGVERFEGRSSLRTWMFRILINRARSMTARESRVAGGGSLHHEDDSDADDFFPEGHPKAGKWREPVSAWPDPERLMLSGELQEHIDRAVAELPEAQREVVSLRDVEGVPTTEACEVLSISENAFRVRLHRARTHIRRRLAGYLDHD